MRLDLAPVDLVRVRETMSELSQVYAKHVDYAIANKTIVKSKLHEGVYARVIAEHPALPTGLVQTIRDNVRGNLKAIHSRHPKKKWKLRPEKSEYSLSIMMHGLSHYVGIDSPFLLLGNVLKQLSVSPSGSRSGMQDLL